MEWPITSKPWAICNEQSTSRSSSKSSFRNNLRLLSPQLPTSETSKEIETCIVDAMRVVHIIPINDLRPPTFKFWACRLTCLIPRNTRQAHPFTLSLMTTDLRKDSWLYPKGDQTKEESGGLLTLVKPYQSWETGTVSSQMMSTSSSHCRLHLWQ